MNILCKECSTVFESELNNRKYCSPECIKVVRNRNQYKYRSSRTNTIAYYYTRYRKGAARRNISFTLTIEEFAEYWQKPCYYCDDDIRTIGIDRSDSSQGYHCDNVVPCCTKCNTMKWNMSVHEFVRRCRKIADKFR